jgi:hypothetical protein
MYTPADRLLDTEDISSTALAVDIRPVPCVLWTGVELGLLGELPPSGHLSRQVLAHAQAQC